MIQTLKDLKEENDRSTKWKEKAARKKLERLARMDGSRLQADAQFVLQRSMHCAMLISSVMTAVSGGDAVQSSPDPIADDPRIAGSGSALPYQPCCTLRMVESFWGGLSRSLAWPCFEPATVPHAGHRVPAP